MPRILWAEDGLDDQYLIRHALDTLPPGPKVTFVEDGREALRALRQDRPDLLVLDLNMPIVDGMQALRQLRSDEATRDLPVIVFSTGREEAAVAESRALGVVEYIQKPFHYAEFTKAVAAICQIAARERGKRS